jgi:hypothetical protein
MAFAPDIKGVCRVGGTLLITSKPTKAAKTKTNKLAMNVVVICYSFLRVDDSLAKTNGST